MATLLEMFEAEGKKLGSGDLYKLKYIFDKKGSGGYGEMEYELRMIFKLIESLKPRQMLVSTEVERSDAFSPTIGAANIKIRDSLGREFSIWYKPSFYVPEKNTAREIVIDFVLLKGNHDSIYNLTPALAKELQTYDPLPTELFGEMSKKLLAALKPVHIAIQCGGEFRYSAIADLKAIDFFLKPGRILIVSEEYLPEDLKMNLPITALPIENVDMNFQKLIETAKRII